MPVELSKHAIAKGLSPMHSINLLGITGEGVFSLILSLRHSSDSEVTTIPLPGTVVKSAQILSLPVAYEHISLVTPNSHAMLINELRVHGRHSISPNSVKIYYG